MNYDVLIIGTGIAGLYTALNLRDDIRILMITKNSFKDCNSYLAQGGISTSLGFFDEENYFNDTMKAGNYNNNPEAVKLLIKNSIENINNLVKLGVPFDKTNDKLNYTREGGHGEFRIIHVKDETGKAVTETLLDKVAQKNNITMLENTTLIDLICEDNICYGGILKNSSKTYSINSKFTILATGGIGGIFTSTTNVEYLTGDGLNISLKNNISIKDMEYLQLHPTVLYEPKVKGKKLLLSESLRGEGGIILNQNKEQFIDTLRRALYGKIDDYTLQDHIRYYEDYIRQEMGKGRTEQEVLQELGDPRLLARTIVETSSLKNPDTVYTVDEEGQNSYGTSEDRVKVHTFTGWKATLLMVVVVAAIILFVVAILGLAFYLLPIILVVGAVIWLFRWLTGSGKF